jgi:hypothetical protein
MSKYYLLMVLVVGIALYFVYLKDPCHQQLRTDFSSKYPGHEILNAEALEGSPESVRCTVSYRKLASGEIFEDIWLYQDLGKGWEFLKIVRTQQKEQAP